MKDGDFSDVFGEVKPAATNGGFGDSDSPPEIELTDAAADSFWEWDYGPPLKNVDFQQISSWGAQQHAADQAGAAPQSERQRQAAQAVWDQTNRMIRRMFQIRRRNQLLRQYPPRQRTTSDPKPDKKKDNDSPSEMKWTEFPEFPHRTWRWEEITR
jgi:hypothetical protein